MKTIIQIVLTIVILALAFLLYRSIQNPIEFNKAREERYEAAIEKLKDIRKAQVAFKSVHGIFANNFDTLESFLHNDSFKIERVEGRIPDSLDLAEALKANIVELVPTKVSVKDSIFSDHYAIDSIKYVPYTNGKIFEMGAGKVMTGSKVEVDVFEVKVSNNVLLNGLDEQLITNWNDEWETITGYAGLKVGSLTETTNNAGNWDY